MDARASYLPQYIRNLNRIERDHFLVRETPEEAFELPDWIDR